ncbi:MAG TPA: hypothetical protein VHD14_05925 [Pseudolabrys sp.]|jgi:hypothetical protein|nr:hypothetical protein [Pseudolabrys sp.]
MHRLPARARVRAGILSSEPVRALIAGGGLAAIFLLVFVIGVRTQHFRFGAAGPAPAVIKMSPEAQTKREEEARRLASILFIPWTSDTCEERQFDNFTGSIVSEAYVNCEQRLTQQKVDMPITPHDNTTRMRAILETFNQMKNR